VYSSIIIRRYGFGPLTHKRTAWGCGRIPNAKNWPLFGQSIHSYIRMQVKRCLFSKLRQNNNQSNGKTIAETVRLFCHSFLPLMAK